jgi:hypothetical protein
VCPLDPGRHWLEAGITGLARQREWDAVATVEGPGAPGDEAEFVALPDGSLVLETGPTDFDPAPLAEALAGSLEPPYRVVAVRRDDVWAVGAREIEVATLFPAPEGGDLELTWDGSISMLVVDRMPADPARASALGKLAGERESGAYAARAHHLSGDLWEILVLPL